jgi:hypothetical protein
MLEAKRADDFRYIYEITVDGQPLTTIEGRLWREGRTVELDGRRYEIHGNLRRTRYEMTDPLGMVVAKAERVGRGRWTVTANGRTYDFRRQAVTSMRQLMDIPSWLFARQREELLIEDGRAIARAAGWATSSTRWPTYPVCRCRSLPSSSCSRCGTASAPQVRRNSHGATCRD